MPPSGKTGYHAQVATRALSQPMAAKALAGFLVSGFLFALLGALLPAWGYDVSSDYAVAGRHFLALVAGMWLSVPLALSVPKNRTPRTLLVTGSSVACGGLLALGLLPASMVWHMAGLVVIGAGAGLLHRGLFEAILPAYLTSPAATINMGGIYFGAGSILTALLVSGTYYAYSTPTILLILAAVPAAFVVIYSRSSFEAVRRITPPSVGKQFRSATAVVCALLLFFQFGNEWAIAGWLPTFLVHRLGASPEAALLFLAFYWTSMTASRLVVYFLLPRVNAWRLMWISTACSLFGCMVLAATDNRLGVVTAIVFLSFGFAATYPLLAAWIGKRFAGYHPAYFNGIFSIAMVGGMLSPWLIGEIAAFTGIWAIMTLPAIGTCLVVVLLVIVWLSAKMSE